MSHLVHRPKPSCIRTVAARRRWQVDPSRAHHSRALRASSRRAPCSLSAVAQIARLPRCDRYQEPLSRPSTRSGSPVVLQHGFAASPGVSSPACARASTSGPGAVCGATARRVVPRSRRNHTASRRAASTRREARCERTVLDAMSRPLRTRVRCAGSSEDGRALARTASSRTHIRACPFWTNCAVFEAGKFSLRFSRRAGSRSRARDARDVALHSSCIRRGGCGNPTSNRLRGNIASRGRGVVERLSVTRADAKLDRVARRSRRRVVSRSRNRDLRLRSGAAPRDPDLAHAERIRRSLGPRKRGRRLVPRRRVRARA